MNTLLLIFLAPFLTSTAVGQVENVQIQTPFLQTAALKFYCRYGSVLNEDVSDVLVTKVGEFAASKVKTYELCVGSVRVTESQFLQMVQSAQIDTNIEITQSGSGIDSKNSDEDPIATSVVSDVVVIEDQVDQNNTSSSQETPLDAGVSTYGTESVLDVVSDTVQNINFVVQESY